MNESLEMIGSLYIVEPEIDNIYNIIKQSDKLPLIISYESLINKNNQNFYMVKQDVQKLYQEFFKLDKVIYYPFDFSIWKRKARKTEKILSQKETISPFQIPIEEYNSEKEINGCVEGQTIKNHNKDTRLVKSISIANCDISRELYAHEIAHTQQLTNDETINAINSEVLSIFIERLAQDYFNTSDKMTLLRLHDLITKIEYLKNHNTFTDDEVLIYKKARNLTYIESTLKAYLLYHIYQTETLSSVKARIIDEINEVFNKQLTVEQLLNNHNITRENCKNTEIFTTILKRR